MDPRVRTLGVLGIENAVRAPAVKEVMTQLLAFGITPIELIWESLTLESVSNWPRCDVLLLFPNAAVNLDKVREYVDLTRCSELNTIAGCEVLKDRAAMYRRCEKFGIPIPTWAESVDPETIVEETDRVVINGKIIDKPFVEKPVDADDHRVYIYFPQSAGGGRMRIDRKYKIFDHLGSVRRDGKYVYQKFVASEGFETKLYAIGGEYVHAEAVPSRMADPGQSEGQPVPIYLRPREKIIPLRVGLAFGLTVFKAHILRTHTPLSNPGTPGKPGTFPQQPRSSILFDISVGRSSFAKQDKDYFIDSASALATEILKRFKLSSAEGTRVSPLLDEPSAPKRVSMTVDFRSGARISSDVQSIKEAIRTLRSQASSSQIAPIPENAPVISDGQLRCVVALVRHGDRTCKQKLTIKFDGFPPEDVAQMRPEEGGEDFRQTADLDRIAQLIAKYRDRRRSDASVAHQALEILHQRVANSGTVSGTPGALDNLKAKIETSVANPEKSSWSIKLKWGGDLTPVGIAQAETAGRFFRKTIYDKKDNILHMHASLHHDLKVYASEDRRCQQTAASFAKGLLELSMQLPVIQTGFVRSDGLGRLDDTPFRHSEQVERTRVDLANLLFGPDRGASLVRRLALSAGAADVLAAVESEYGCFANSYAKMDEEVCSLVKLLATVEEGARLYGKETIVLLRNRWYELKKQLDQLRTNEPSPGKLSVIGDVFDNAVYDSRHNLAFLTDLSERVGERLRSVRTLIRKLYSIVTPCEYGLEAEHKAVIGATFIHPLVRKFRWDVRVASGADLGEEEEHLVRYAELYQAIGIENQVRTRLYFAHHSHMLSFLNVLRFGFIRGELDMTAENADWLNSKVTHLGYLSQIIMQLYEYEGEWLLRILLMPGDDFNSAHGSIAFANNQKLIFTCVGSLEKIDNLFTAMLNIVALPRTPPRSSECAPRSLSPEETGAF